MGSGLDGQVRTAKLDPAPWWQYQVAGDVTVWVQAGVAPWRARQIRKALDQMAAALGMPEKEGKGDDE